jgi:hypothetical protein
MTFDDDVVLQRRLNPLESETRSTLLDCLKESPIPSSELLNNMGLFMDRRFISRMLFVDEMYRRQLGLHGSIFEFGVRYGQNLALLMGCRGIYEPYNHNRKIIGFDTFSGFPSVHETDTDKHSVGDYSVPPDYRSFLERVLTLHENMAPIDSIKKFELVEGDASTTVKEYLAKRPETIISLAYFDFDIYQPTFDCLTAILPYLNRGAVIGFDEINDREWPGESVALREVLTLSKFEICHSKYRANAGYLIYTP